MKKILLISCLLTMILFTACGKSLKENRKVEDYEELDDIISIKEIDMQDKITDVLTYNVRYKSDDCEVVAYLSVPESCMDKQEAYPCIIFNRGGNRDFSMNKPEDIAYLASASGKVVFASQYRGVSGGTGTDEFGGADLHDVTKLIDLCSEFSFVDMDNLYMMGISRGGMMTYMAAREDSRIKKAVVVSGIADCFMSWAEREDMKEVYLDLIGKTPDEAPEEYEKRSAVYWADEIKCPVMIIHSSLDEKVSYTQAEKMVECLEKAGKEYKFVNYDDNIHGLHPQDFDIIMDWFS